MITEIELARAVARARVAGALAVDEMDVLAITWAALEIDLTPEIRQAAALLEPAEMRALDCIHIASAVSLGTDRAAVLTYDNRMQYAASVQRLEVLAPS